MKRCALALLMFALAGCFPLKYAGPTLTPPVRDSLLVAASFGRTWDAAINVFAENNLAIQTLDRSSGLLVPRDAQYAALMSDTVATYADCGMEYPNNSWRKPLAPTSARFNIVVRGDSARSSVLVRAFFTAPIPAGFLGDCRSRGVYESSMERLIKARAERGK
jgi:hypothetical protein